MLPKKLGFYNDFISKKLFVYKPLINNCLIKKISDFLFKINFTNLKNFFPGLSTVLTSIFFHHYWRLTDKSCHHFYKNIWVFSVDILCYLSTLTY